MRMLKHIVQALTLCLVLPTAVSAQYSDQIRNSDELRGRSIEQLGLYLGEPDKMQNESGNRQVLHYGRSQVFLTEGKVSGWSDLGELSERRKLSKIRRQNEEVTSPQSQADWTNVWTPKERPPAEAVLDELLPEHLRTEPQSADMGKN